MKHSLMINIETDTGTTRIKLLDNPFVNEWKQHFIYMLNNAEYSFQYSSLPYLISEYKETGVLTKRVTALKEVIEELNTFVTFPVSTDDIDKRVDYSLDFMQLLNEIHRYSTTAVRVMRLNKSDGNAIELYWTDNDPYNSKFTVKHDDIEKFDMLMEQVNLGVHNVDCTVPTPRKLSTTPSDTFEVSFNFTEPEVLDHEDNKVFFKNTSEHTEYMSDSGYDVWMGFDILGKNYQEAYFDHDNPTEWDVTHPLGHSGGFHINLTDTTLQTLIKGDDMQNWFKSYNIEYTKKLNNFPLGNVIEGKDNLHNINPNGAAPSHTQPNTWSGEIFLYTHA